MGRDVCLQGWEDFYRGTSRRMESERDKTRIIRLLFRRGEYDIKINCFATGYGLIEVNK